MGLMYWGAEFESGGYDGGPHCKVPVSHEHVVTMDLQELIAEIIAFRDERDWGRSEEEVQDVIAELMGERE